MRCQETRILKKAKSKEVRKYRPLLRSDLIRRRREVVLPANMGPMMTWISPETRGGWEDPTRSVEFRAMEDLQEDIDIDEVRERNTERSESVCVKW